MKIAVCLHLFYIDMIDVMISYLQNLKRDFDLYVSLVLGYYDDNTIHKLKKFKSDVKIIIVENKGVDIGGFLQILKLIPKNTDLILKIHTKKGVGLPETPSRSVIKKGFDETLKQSKFWFNNLMRGVLETPEKTERILQTFESNKSCGMVGYKLYNNSQVNKNEILNLLPLFELPNECLNWHFIGGTIFWVRYSIIQKYFHNELIDIIMDKTKIGYVHEPSVMHAIERIFGYVVINEKKEILVIN